MTGAIQGAFKEKLYQELGLESLHLRRWYRKLGIFCQTYKNKTPQYLFKLISEKSYGCVIRNVDNIPFFNIRRNFFKNCFFPVIIIEGNNLDPNLWNSKSFGVFKDSILTFIRPSPSSVFNSGNHKGVKLITLLHVGRSHLREHKFKHNFKNCLNQICCCGLDID